VRACLLSHPCISRSLSQRPSRKGYGAVGIETVRRARRDSLTAGQLREKPGFVTRERITAIDFNGSNKMQVASAAHFSVAERTAAIGVAGM